MMCLLPHVLSAQQPVFLEAPLVLQAPGYEDVLPAYYDSEMFWIAPAPLMERLGYEIPLSDSTQLIVRDRSRAISFDYSAHRIVVNTEEVWTGEFSMSGPDGEMLVTVASLQSAFGADMEWDQAGLTLRLSSAATLFDPAQFGRRRHLSIEPREEVLFGRERTLFGGFHVGYSVDHRWKPGAGRTLSWVTRTTANVAGGTLRWQYSRRFSGITYTYTLSSPWLTRIQIGQADHPGRALSLRISNRPLVPRRVHRQRTLRGTTLPHAIVRGKVSGFSTDQVQADRDGRYAVRVPIFYGSTHSEVEVEPLGGEPEMVMDYHNLTPQRLLPRGAIEYDLSLSESGSGSLSWGIAPHLTLHAEGRLRPQRGVLGATALLRPTLYMDTEADMISRSGIGLLQWWQSWGGVNARYRVQRTPDAAQDFSAAAMIAGKKASLQAELAHRAAENTASSTSLGTTLGWQFLELFEFRAGGNWRLQSESATLRADVWGTFLARRTRVRARAGVEARDQKDISYRGGTHLFGRTWTGAVQLEYFARSGELGITASAQINTDWVWMNTGIRYRGAQVEHIQSVRGAILFGKDIRFSAIYRESTQAIFRFFVDANVNGELDSGETLFLYPRIQIPTIAVSHRPGGEVAAINLEPHRTYSVQILPESITDAVLYPVTGYRFSFVATPGRTRYIDIALQPLPFVSGRLTGWDTGYASLRIELYDRGERRELDVYSDGGFIVNIPAGEYPLTVIDRLTGTVVMQDALIVRSGMNQVMITLPGDL